MKSKVSIIMPCLNMVNYIKNCLDSVIQQTLKSLEILIIDAGSTDGTCNILNEYASRDPRIKILHSDRKSYGYQVNLGLYHASGDYIGIVDTDDMIAPDMYETLYQKAIISGADYVKGTAKGFYTIVDTEKYYFSIAPFSSLEYNPDIKLVPKETPALLTKDNFLWYGLYKSSFLKQIKLNESPGAAFQDFGALFQIQTKAEKAIYIDKIVYYYRLDNMNASTYNQKGFSFIAEEYTFAENFLHSLSLEWHIAFYRKFFLHFMDRMYVMAASGTLWESALQDIQIISNRLQEANTNGFLAQKDLSDIQWNDLQLLWSDPYLLFNKYKEYYRSVKTALRNIVEFLEGSSGIIFGGGNYGRFIHAQLLYRGYKNIVAYCDNRTEIQGIYQYGIEILSPKRAVPKFSKGKYIIANKYHAEEMKEQLISLGVPEKLIISYTFGIHLNLFGLTLDPPS